MTTEQFHIRFRATALLLALVASAVILGPRLSSQAQGSGTININGQQAVAGEVIVKFARAQTANERVQLETQISSDVSETVAPNMRRLHSSNYDTQTLVSFLQTNPNVAYAEPNYIVHTTAVPNDPQFPNLWGLLNDGHFGLAGADIKASSAWDVSTGSRANVVAVIDTGIDYTHPDLAANIWSAPAAFSVTIGGMVINCAAGTHGYNAIARTCNPRDDHNHGTHVTGTIGAVGNNGADVVGVNWTASVMGGKFMDATGRGSVSNAINTIEFAIQAKNRFAGTGGANVRVLSNSWGGSGFSMALLDEINKANANDMLFVVAAGNASSNNSLFPTYPASYVAPNVLAVAASDSTDHLAGFSNYGPSVVLAAPGVSVLSTTIGNTYRYYSGTSMATPHVAGAAALILSQCALTTAVLKTTIVNNVDVIGALVGWVASSGRLNVDRAIRSCATTGVPAAPTGLIATGGDARVTLVWTASIGATSYNVKRGTVSGGPYAQVAANVAATTYVDTSAINGTTYYYVVTAVKAGSESGPSNQASATPRPPVPVAPTGLTAVGGNASVTLAWSASSGATGYNVKRGTSSGGPYAQIAGNVAAVGYLDLSVINGTTYYYVVTAMNASGESGNSNQASGTPVPPVPAPPTGLTALGGTASVTLAWIPSSGATAYNVKRSTLSGGPYAPIATNVTPAAYADLSVINGTTYYYVVTAVNASGESGNSNQASGTPVPPVPAAPTGLTALGGTASVTLAWIPSSGATAYNVKRSALSGGPYAPIATNVTPAAYADLSVINGTTYYYVVTAVNVSGESGNSNQASGTPVPPVPAPPTGLTALGGTASVTLAWIPSSGATAYNVKRSTLSGGPYAPIATNVTPAAYADLSVINGTTYYYVVTAVNVSGESGNSNQASGTPVPPVPAPPTGLTALGGTASVTLAWIPSSGATAYNVKRSTLSGGPYAPIATNVTPAAYADLSVINGTTYYYVVTAVNVSGESGNSNQASATPTPVLPVPGVPKSVSAQASVGKVYLFWNAATGATSYTIKRSLTSGGPYSDRATGVTGSFFIDPAESGTQYYYVIVGVNSAGPGPASPEVTAIVK